MVEEQIKGKIEDIWANFDTNSNGVLEKTEFRAFYDVAKGELAQIKGVPDIEDFEAVFAFFDTNKNGSIEKAEMLAIIMKAYAEREDDD